VTPQTQQQTFLFMDLVGFTALTAERGDEDAAEVALRFYAHVRPLLPEHCGEEIKTIGDAMMIRCDEPRQAIALAVRICDEVGEALDFPPVRIGVHTGSAVCREGDWYGNAVNVAARLCSAAGGGDVLVSDATREAAGTTRRIEFGERQLHWLKNVPDPVAARSASRHACSGPRQRLGALAKLASRRSAPTVSLRHSEVTG
jgi:class 3 adenylate cyclase